MRNVALWLFFVLSKGYFRDKDFYIPNLLIQLKWGDYILIFLYILIIN